MLRGAGPAADEGAQVARAGDEAQPCSARKAQAWGDACIRCSAQLAGCQVVGVILRFDGVLLQGAIATRGEGLYEGLDW